MIARAPFPLTPALSRGRGRNTWPRPDAKSRAKPSARADRSNRDDLAPRNAAVGRAALSAPRRKSHHWRVLYSYGAVPRLRHMDLALVASALGKTVATAVAKKFGGKVVERWTRYRAEQFFEGFVETIGVEISSGLQSDEVDEQLDAILADDTKTEVLFDSYRRVCFSKSKKLGPRIIGILTGQLVHEGRMADSSDERIFAAAELLSDGEFIDFMKGYYKHRKQAEGLTDLKGEYCMLGESVLVQWSRQASDLRGFIEGEVDIGSFPWEDALGRWAVVLHQCGLLEDRIQQTTMATTTTITFALRAGLRPTLRPCIQKSRPGES